MGWAVMFGPIQQSSRSCGLIVWATKNSAWCARAKIQTRNSTKSRVPYKKYCTRSSEFL